MSTTTVTVQRTRMAWLARLADLIELSKPRIGTLVVISVAVAYWVGAGGEPDMLVLAGILPGTLLVAASASALNQLIERRRDALMERTARRPLPGARLRPRDALMFALASLLVGLTLIAVSSSSPPLLWTFLTWILYVFVYTPSKVVTPLNTLIGAIPGAMPILIGWSASGAAYDLRVAALYGVLFLWQFPHFMAIAWMYRRQYDRAGMQMLSVVDPTGRRAGRHALVAAATLIPVSLLPTLLMPLASGWVYGLAALTLSLCQMAFALAFQTRLTDQAARRLLRCSLLYLPALLLLMVLFPWA